MLILLVVSISLSGASTEAKCSSGYRLENEKCVKTERKYCSKTCTRTHCSSFYSGKYSTMRCMPQTYSCSGYKEQTVDVKGNILRSGTCH